MSFQWVWAYVPQPAPSTAPPDVLLPLPHPFGTVLNAPMPPPGIPKKSCGLDSLDGMGKDANIPVSVIPEGTPMTPKPPQATADLRDGEKFAVKSENGMMGRVAAPPPIPPPAHLKAPHGPMVMETVVVEDEPTGPPSKKAKVNFEKDKIMQPRPKSMPNDKCDKETFEAVKTEKTEKKTHTRTFSSAGSSPGVQQWGWWDGEDWGGSWASWDSWDRQPKGSNAKWNDTGMKQQPWTEGGGNF